MTDSTTGGNIQPHPQPPPINAVPANLTLVQFIQSVLVGMSGIRQDLVRPEWQVDPPKSPDLPVNWVAFGIAGIKPDANAYESVDENNVFTLQRQEDLRITLSVYGPAAADNITLIRDNFQIPQNNATLKKANMGYVDMTEAQHMPDLFNERWIDRYISELTLHRYIQRTYPVLTFASANGTAYTQTAANNNFQIPFAVSGG